MGEAFSDFGMKTRNVVIHMECDGEASWLKFLGDVWPIQSVDQWVNWLTNPSSGEEITNTNWLIVVFPVTKKNDGRPDPDIKSWAQPVKALRNLLKKSFNLKGSLVFFSYYYPDGLTEFSGSSNIQIGRKNNQGVIYNTY